LARIPSQHVNNLTILAVSSPHSALACRRAESA